MKTKIVLFFKTFLKALNKRLLEILRRLLMKCRTWPLDGRCNKLSLPRWAPSFSCFVQSKSIRTARRLPHPVTVIRPWILWSTSTVSVTPSTSYLTVLAYCHVSVFSESPLGNSPDFKAGVTALANILKIQRHDDYLVMLKVSVCVGHLPHYLCSTS